MAQQTKKRTPRRRTAPRRKSRKEQGAFRPLLMGMILLLLIAAVGFTAYFFGYEAGREEHLNALNAEKQHSLELRDALKKAREETARHEYDKVPPQPAERTEKSAQKRVEVVRPKPMLAIIIDDVSFERDVRNIKALGLTLNLSFLPPSKRHPDSAELAQKEPFYMVHLPLEAMAFGGEEPQTLHVGDSEAVIEARVRQIRELYPKARFVNNHTGSRFTADGVSMERLIYALDREGITFVDSRTTGKTAVPELMKSLHRPYISRDVFLDHDPDVEAVKQQVRRAVRIAKKYGYAIAIGHPHKKTLQGLAESKGVLREVELVRIDTLAAYLK